MTGFAPARPRVSVAGFDPETPGVTPPANSDRHGAFLVDVVVELGFADQEAVEGVAEAARRSTQTIERALLESGVLDEDQLSRAIAERTGLDHVDLDGFDVDMEAAAMLGRSTALRYRAAPIAFAADGALIVAVADPCESLGISDIESITRSEVRPVIASASGIHDLIERLPAEGAAPVPTPAPEVEEARSEATEEERPEPPSPPPPSPPSLPEPPLPPRLEPPPMPRPTEPVRSEARDRSTDLEALREAVRKADDLAAAVGRRIGELEEAGERAQRLESELAAAQERIAALEQRHSRLVAAAGEATAAIEKLGALSRALEETDS